MKLLTPYPSILMFLVFLISGFQAHADSLTFREDQAPPDMDKQQITLKMTYRGCATKDEIDTSLKGGKMKFRFQCVDGQKIVVRDGLTPEQLEKKINGDRPYRGNIGVVTVDYDSGKRNCKVSDTDIEVVYKLDHFYEQLGKSSGNCNTDKIAALSFMDSPPIAGSGSGRGRSDYPAKASESGSQKKSRPAKQVLQYKNIGSQCRLPFQEVQLPGFASDSPDKVSDAAKIRMRDNELLIGDHTSYKWDSINKKWIARWVQRDKKGRVQYVKKYENASLKMSTPIPIMFNRKHKGKICAAASPCKRTHLAGSVILSPDGTAKIVSHKKVYKNPKDVFKDLRKKKHFDKLVDNSAGTLKVDMNHVGNRNKVRQTKVSAYDKDGKHIRTVNFLGRNVYGSQMGRRWCEADNCIDHRYARQFTRRAGSQNSWSCRDKKGPVDLSRGGSGNQCHSCFGVTPGACSEDSEKVISDQRKKEKAKNSNKYYDPKTAKRALFGLVHESIGQHNSTRKTCGKGYAKRPKENPSLAPLPQLAPPPSAPTRTTR